MQNFQDTFETSKRLFISAFSICMTVPLSQNEFQCSFKGPTLWNEFLNTTEEQIALHSVFRKKLKDRLKSTFNRVNFFIAKLSKSL